MLHVIVQNFNGFADCRMSASLYNHKMILKADKPNTIEMGLARAVGFAFNQTKVETEFGKCAYVFDGASGNRYNYGCGVGAGELNCSKPGTAFADICPSTGKTCTADDDEVKRVTCVPDGPMPIPDKGTDGACFYGGPALDYPQSNRPNHLRKMVKARVPRQTGSDAKGPLISQWNEVVLDEHLLIPSAFFDPALVVTAFIYVKSQPNALGIAQAMRDEFSVYFSVGKLPVIGVDDTVDFTTIGGPFFTNEQDLEVIEMI